MLFAWHSSGTHSDKAATLGFLAYNVTAFGLQPLIGYFCDAHRKTPVEAIGCFLLIAGLFFMQCPAASIALIGLGNACFHVGGGIDCLRNAGGKMARSGVFVSAGALGVGVGTLAGKGGSLPVYVPMGILALCTVLIFAFCIRHKETSNEKAVFSVTKPEAGFGAIVFLPSVSIAVRSFAGSIILAQAAWRTTPAFFLFPALGAFLGKASGGFLADSIGARKVAVFSLLSSSVLLAFWYASPWAFIIGIALFNMNMPVTLCAIASVLPRCPGLSFGITTLALLCGNVPTFFMSVANPSAVFAVLTVVSALCLCFVLDGKAR
ncbi:MAG: hypothetical protein FWG53_11735 [Clostridiales bacterium]|nr:hypothetical protein [Clostridiales bacterium]